MVRSLDTTIVLSDYTHFPSSESSEFSKPESMQISKSAYEFARRQNNNWGEMRFRIALLTAALAATSMLLAPPAQALTPGLTATDLAFVMDSSLRLGISPKVRDRLIANLEKGIQPESATGAEPISTKTKRSPEKTVVTKEFSDGSVAETTFEDPARGETGPTKGEVTPMSIRGCSDWSGVGTWEFRNCSVRTDQFTFSMGFDSDGRRGTDCSPNFAAKIYSVYGAWYSGVGSVGGITQEVLQGTQNCSSAARGRASAIVSMTYYSFTVSLTFYVQNTSRWDTSP